MYNNVQLCKHNHSIKMESKPLLASLSAVYIMHLLITEWICIRYILGKLYHGTEYIFMASDDSQSSFTPCCGDQVLETKHLTMKLTVHVHQYKHSNMFLSVLCLLAIISYLDPDSVKDQCYVCCTRS